MSSKFYLLIGLGLIFLAGCEEEYIPETVFEQPEIVVEGYIEKADSALPPYVLLTESRPYLSEFSTETINGMFVHGADVRISDGTDTVQLTEICLADLAGLDTALRNSVAQGLGLSSNGIFTDSLNPCVYVDAAAFINGQTALSLQAGTVYTLMVQVAGRPLITAQTTMVDHVPLDSFWYQNHPNYPQNDSLVQVLGLFQDPPNVDNYYRLFSKRNSEQFFPASTLGVAVSVTDDKIFAGQSSSFGVQRGQAISRDFDPNTFGYFWRGDTATVRASSLDYAHFRFWQTLEYNANAQGPFGNYVRVQSNVKNALGVFGAIAYKDYTLIIPR